MTYKLTPVMQQYLDLKAENPSAMLLFRLGDFYEVFFGDAVTVGRALDIVVTSRGTDDRGVDIPMCGIPWHAAENYIGRLVKAGITVAIAEQMETPEEARMRGAKQMNRQVVRVITPGTLTDENLLSPKKSNFLMSIIEKRKTKDESILDSRFSIFDIAAVDISTGEFLTGEGDFDDIIRMNPAEVLFDESLAEAPDILRLRQTFNTTPLHSREYDNFERGNTAAEKMIFSYIARTQKGAVINILPAKKLGGEKTLGIDASTWASLEIDKPANDGGLALVDIIDRTKSAAGGRMLKSWLGNIPTDLDLIQTRQNHIAHLVTNGHVLRDIAGQMARLPDIFRSITRLVADRGFPRDLMAIKTFLDLLPGLRAAGLKTDEALAEKFQNMEMLAKLHTDLNLALSDKMPALFREGFVIKTGFDSMLDSLRDLASGAKETIADLAGEYSEKTGVNVKIKFNNILGYFIEVTDKAATALQSDDTFIHRQTMAGNMRFTTTRLAELDREIQNAATEASRVEARIIESIIAKIRENTGKILNIAEFLAEVDVYCSLADAAEFWNWARPELGIGNHNFSIEGGRHPVVEKTLRDKSDAFVKNNSELGKYPIALLTGPNMAGKSTYLRQNALIVILAHLGSFVPADSAKIPIMDRVFSRVGASDNLASGQSTFMVEMTETANILKSATKNSFIIFDEIGRGTATFDGMAIAEAVLEYTANIGCKCLFATHYHELTKTNFKGVKNLTIKIAEDGDKIVFLHKIIDGVANKSYGIHVAKLAGMPDAVIKSAERILAGLEDKTEFTADKTGQLKMF